MSAKQGDVVRIKSGGGPLMSVGCRIGDAHWCHWWDEEEKIFKAEVLYLSQLEVIKQD
jgi:uncharacterized protein YodC (DUF2158 family)